MNYDLTRNPIPTDNGMIERVVTHTDGTIMVAFVGNPGVSTECGPFVVVSDPVLAGRCRAAARQADEAKAKREAKRHALLSHNPFRNLRLA